MTEIERYFDGLTLSEDRKTRLKAGLHRDLPQGERRTGIVLSPQADTPAPARVKHRSVVAASLIAFICVGLIGAGTYLFLGPGIAMPGASSSQEEPNAAEAHQAQAKDVFHDSVEFLADMYTTGKQCPQGTLGPEVFERAMSKGTGDDFTAEEYFAYHILQAEPWIQEEGVKVTAQFGTDQSGNPAVARVTLEFKGGHTYSYPSSEAPTEEVTAESQAAPEKQVLHELLPQGQELEDQTQGAIDIAGTAFSEASGQVWLSEAFAYQDLEARGNESWAWFFVIDDTGVIGIVSEGSYTPFTDEEHEAMKAALDECLEQGTPIALLADDHAEYWLTDWGASLPTGSSYTQYPDETQLGIDPEDLEYDSKPITRAIKLG